MAEKAVIFRDNQELQAADLNNQQDWQGEAVDHVVLDAVEDGSAYAGFAVTKAQATTVQITRGPWMETFDRVRQGIALPPVMLLERQGSGMPLACDRKMRATALAISGSTWISIE